MNISSWANTGTAIVTPGWTGDRYGNPHYFPIGTIWAFAVIDTLPWSLLLPLAAWRWRKEIKASAQRSRRTRRSPQPPSPACRRTRPTARPVNRASSGSDERAWQGYLLIWALTPLLFFTLARNIMLPYVLPGMPAAAILAGGWLARQRRRGYSDRSLARQRPRDHARADVRLGRCTTSASPTRWSTSRSRRCWPLTIMARAQPMLCACGQFARLGADVIRRATLVHLGPSFLGPVLRRGQAIKGANEDEAWRRIGAGAGYVATPSGDALIAVRPSQGGTGAVAASRGGRWRLGAAAPGGAYGSLRRFRLDVRRAALRLRKNKCFTLT